MTISRLLSVTRVVDGAYRTICAPVIKAYGLSQTSFDILMFLANNPEYYTAKQVSRMRNLKENVVSLHVERLAKEGYLHREPVEGDRRKVRLICTEKAMPLIEAGRKVQKEFYEEMLAGISQEEMEGFRRCIEAAEKTAAAIRSRAGACEKMEEDV